MARDLGLANRIRAKGVRVVEVAGWQTRGSSTFNPVGSINHHTAGAASGRTPSLNICINGRTGLAGPLCNVFQSREPDGNDIAYIVASGKANHGGVGAWRGVSGNAKFHGLEIEHTGFGSVPQQRLEIAARIQAAFLEYGSRNPAMCCQHFEYAQPRGRKPDFRELGPWFNADSFRSRVGFWIGRTAGGITVPPVTPAPPAGPRILQLASPFMEGTDVRDLQTKLKTVQYPPMVVDGVYGFDTNHIVVKFQEAANLTADGRVGPVTWAELNKRYAAATAPAKPKPPTLMKGQKNMYLIKGDQTPHVYLSDGLTKRHMKNWGEINIWIWMAQVAANEGKGVPISTKPDNQPHVLPEALVDGLERVGA